MAYLKENLAVGTGLENVAAFGHEIKHHRNGDSASIRGEMKAYEVEYQLRDKFHAPHHDKADALHGLNPYDRKDQLRARTILGDRYDEFPLTPLNEEVPREAFSTVVNFSMGARGVFEEAGGALANIAKIGAYELDKFAKSLAVNLFP